MELKDRLDALQQAVDYFNRGLKEVRAGLQDLETRLAQVSHGQEGFELQLALLSKEAEQYDSRLSLVDGENRSRSSEPFSALRDEVAELRGQVDRLLSEKSTLTKQRLLSVQLSELQNWLATDGQAIGSLLNRVEALELDFARAERRANERDAGSAQREPGKPADSRQGFATDVASSTQRKTLSDEVAALKTAGGFVYDRLVRLEQQRRSLKDSLAALSVEHARRDSETQTLKKQLRRSAFLTWGTLLVAATLGIVWISQAFVAEPERASIPNAVTEADTAAIDVSELAEDIALLRDDMGLLEASLATVRRKVDQIIASPAPALSREVERLSATVVSLVDSSVRQQQAASLAEADQMSGQQAVPDFEGDAKPRIDHQSSGAKQPSDMPAVSLPPRSGGSPEVPRVSASRELSTPIPSTASTIAGRATEKWAEARADRRYTLQLMGVQERRYIEAFLRKKPLAVDLAVHVGERAGRPWFTLLHGIYGSLREAQAAAKKLPNALLKQKPWVRRIPATGRLEAQ